MTYTQRIDRVLSMLTDLQREGAMHDKQHGVHMGHIAVNTLAEGIGQLRCIAVELDTTPRAPDGGGLTLIASFPYTHPDDRDTRRLAIYDKPCPSGDGSGEYIIWSEVRETDHDGFREASRFNGDYTGYVGADERNAAYYQTLDKFSYKCARIVGPFVPEKNRGYRRAN